MSKNKNNNMILNMMIDGGRFLQIPEGLDTMLGAEKAIVLMRLLERFQICVLKKSMKNGYFYYLQDEMLTRTKISKKKQTAIIVKLVELGLVTIGERHHAYEHKKFTFTEDNLKNIKNMINQGRELIEREKNKGATNAFVEKIMSGEVLNV